jgi:hypothetical protein
MDTFKFVDRIPNWVRWILYIPVPFIVARLVIVLGSICTNLVIGGGFEYESDSLIYSTLFIIYDNALTPALMGLSGFILAPKKKFICGLIQAIVWGLFVVCSLCITITVLIMQDNIASLGSWEAIKLYLMSLISVISVIYITVTMFKMERETVFKNISSDSIQSM